ncbi:MAG: delta-aminolevulinic acid dehydratase [Candidatus Parcubacteria bacterium]|jgi:porphobilinogen synthase
MKYIACVFLKEGIDEKQPSPMVGVDYHTLKSGLEFIKNYLDQGIRDFLVFGSTDNKSIEFACADGLIKNFIKTAKEKFGTSIVIYADVGLSPYSTDGHSLIMVDEKVDYQKSYEIAGKLAVVFAGAGADYVCPCLPLENQVCEVKKSLSESGMSSVKIMGYSAKFSSSLYGPYFKTIQSPKDGKIPYEFHIAPLNAEEALNHIFEDEKQGADIVMIKPAMMYLDIIYRARQQTGLPISVYHVSGEYSMLKEGGRIDIVDENEAFDEIHSAFKRCGVDYVIGYAPDHFLRWSNKNN